jgi:hypothetical protein
MAGSASKKVVILNGSPKINEGSTSEALGDIVEARFARKDLAVARVAVEKSLRLHQTDADFSKMSQADALMLIFPLYIFCLPGLLQRFLQDYRLYLAGHPTTGTPRVYALVNCGFPEADINQEAVRVVASFARAIGGSFGFGIMAGAGPLLTGARQAPFMNHTLQELDRLIDRMADDIQADVAPARPPFSLPAPVASRVYLWMGNLGWKRTIHKAGLSEKAMLARPYRDSAEPS